MGSLWFSFGLQGAPVEILDLERRREMAGQLGDQQLAHQQLLL